MKCSTKLRHIQILTEGVNLILSLAFMKANTVRNL